MESYLLLVIFLPLGYLLGSIPSQYIVKKLKKNTATISHTIKAVSIFIIDILKTILPIYIGSLYFSSAWTMALISISPLIGHLFSIWKTKEGNKEIVIIASTIIICGWEYSLILAIIWTGLLYITKSANLNNMIAILFLPLIFWLSTGLIIYVYLGLLYILAVYSSYYNEIGTIIADSKKKI